MTDPHHDMSQAKDEDHQARESDNQDHVPSRDERLEEQLEDSMDASDPPSTTKPGDHGDPVPSSGYQPDDDEKEA